MTMAIGDVEPLEIAVLVPCYNEALTIGKVVADFRSALPGARVYVYDNNSQDQTMEVAAKAGAVVRREPRQGKGNVVRRMLGDIDADVYVLVDGDDTYDAFAAPAMVDLLLRESQAMVVGKRIHSAVSAYRSGHVLGNTLFTSTVAQLFGQSFTDILSGYRVFSKAFVKSFPIFALGFEIETELTVHALTLKLPVSEVESEYRPRPEGSASKLNTYLDGSRILYKIVQLVRTERPMLFYGVISILLGVIAVLLAYPLFVTFFETGKVPRFPTGMVVVGLAVMSSISLVSGLMLDAVTRGRREMKLLAYLAARSQGAGARIRVKREATVP